MKATIGTVDAAGYHLITGFNLLRVLRYVPSVAKAETGVWVNHDFIEQASETLRAAGYVIAQPLERTGRRTAPGGATDAGHVRSSFAEPLAPLPEWTEEDQRRSHEGWRAATRALGNDPDVIERTRKADDRAFRRRMVIIRTKR